MNQEPTTTLRAKNAMNKTTAFVLLTVSVLTAETIAGQNLIRDGGFEADDLHGSLRCQRDSRPPCAASASPQIASSTKTSDSPVR